MKQLIRKWLGIPNTTPIREEVEKVVFGETYINQLSERIEHRLYWREAKRLIDQVNEATQKELQNKVGTEQFIDQIVQRIRNKQI